MDKFPQKEYARKLSNAIENLIDYFNEKVLSIPDDTVMKQKCIYMYTNQNNQKFIDVNIDY